MTWLHFTLWLLAGYGGYYAVLILWDMLRSETTRNNKGLPVLSFAEPVTVTTPPLEVIAESPLPAVKGLGGIPLKQAFELCREDVVEYSRGIIF